MQYVFSKHPFIFLSVFGRNRNLSCTKYSHAMWLLNVNCFVFYFCCRIFTGSTRLDGNAIGESSYILWYSYCSGTFLSIFGHRAQSAFSLLIANIFSLFVS